MSAPEKKQELDEEMTETQAKQIELDKTAADFRALHAERQKLIAQWQASIETMKVRDREIAEAGERFAKAKLVVEQAQEVLQKEQERLRLEEQKTVSKEAANEDRQRVVSALPGEPPLPAPSLVGVTSWRSVMRASNYSLCPRGFGRSSYHLG